MEAGHTGGESETLIGRWLTRSGKRAKVVLATKVGSWAKHPGLRASSIAAAVDDSLRRLQTEVIDVYQAHKDDTETPLEETMTAFDALVKAGKVRVLGASNYSAPRLTEALTVSRTLGLARFESLQPEYNLYDRAGYEQTLEPVARREHLGVIGYFSLARGFLTGKYRSAADLGQSARGAGVKGYLNPRGDRILRALDAVAKTRGATVAQVSLAWLMARPGITAPIASATSVTQLKDIAGAVRLALSADELKVLTEASA